MKVRNVRGAKIGVAENTESGVCFKWRYIQYICTATDGEEKVSRAIVQKEKRTRREG